MPEANKPRNKKTNRLGRGLGSLLSPDVMDLNQSPLEPVPNLQQTSKESFTGEVPVKAEGEKHKGVPQEPGKALGSMTVKRNPSAEGGSESFSGLKEEMRIWNMPIDKITANKKQPRRDFDPEALQELAASIRAKGLLQPITVRRTVRGDFEIIAGERRWRASQIAGLHEIPVLIKSASEQSSLELALIENIQREDLNPIEEAEAYGQLIKKYHMTQQQLADRLGKERVSVANSLRLMSLSADVREMVKQAELSPGHAKVLLGLGDPKTQLKLARKAVKGKLSVRATEKLVKKEKQSELSHRESPGNFDVDISQRLVAATVAELQKITGRKTGVDYKNSQGKISLHFYSDEEFSEIVENLKAGWRK